MLCLLATVVNLRASFLPWFASTRALSLATVLVLAFALAGCSSNQGLPGQPGFYNIVGGSLKFDGERYDVAWVDGAGGVHFAGGRDFRLVQDGRDGLEVGDGSPIVHLQEGTPIAVQGRDSRGGYSSFWFPFLLGRTLGGPSVFGQPGPGTGYTPPPTTPTYRYPPTDQVSRDDSLHGSVGSTKPVPPDYNKIRSTSNAVGGQSGGTGAGTATTSKGSGGTSGQTGGAGTGSAATSKGSTGVTGGGVQGARSSGTSLGRSSGGVRTGRK